ncbi:hypothetical protein POPTR_002G130500v4 [Populus trichocarpa]|jgi:hypothetical protein|uniref:Uncharacterized protein n=1 Tax=Populus trichocarpa TaxID=3694 RepID=B9GP03_POPTR|nr:hypothetical protein POPTR_002G130500v4 [Populus trichocarpa]
MSSLVSKSQSSLSKPEDINNSTNTHTKDQEILINSVTSFIYLKPVHPTETRDKEEVLQRIRQRKRVNKVRDRLQGFLGWLFSSKSENEVSVKWVDDAFAAP